MTITTMEDNHIVGRIRELLGPETLLVPCVRGTKVPMQPYKHRPDDEFMTPAWLSLFDVEKANVAVLLGQRSKNIIAIDFDDDSYGLEFDACNGHILDTLRTAGARGWQVWFRIPDGVYPNSMHTPQCEWRADGNLSTIAGVHPKGMHYRFIDERPPKEIQFTDIIWPQGWTVPHGNHTTDELLATIEANQGPAFFCSPKGDPNQLNEAFWGALYAEENILLWAPDEARFYSYSPSNGLWDKESDASIRTKICNRLLKASSEMNVGWLARQRSANKISGIIKHIEGQVCKRRPFNKEMDFLHIANGVLLWRGDKFTFEDFSSHFYSRNASPISYQPGADCPRFKNELLNRSLRPEDAALLQKFCGLYLLGRNPIQMFLILEGAAGTGKSQIAAIIRGLVGEWNCVNLRTELLGERFEMANYRGKSLLIGSDVGGDFLCNNGAQHLKALTGGDQLMVELKGSNDSEPIFGNFNVLLTTNCRLRVRLQEDLGAWRRRIAIINFTGTPPARIIPDFGKVLLHDEGPGILNWAIEGLTALFAEQTNNNGRIQLDQVQIDLVDRLLLESQSLKAFLQECVQQDAELDLTTAEILEAYSEWCDAKKIDPIPEYTAQKQLPHIMLDLFQVSKNNDVYRNEKRQRGFNRVSFKNQTDSDVL